MKTRLLLACALAITCVVSFAQSQAPAQAAGVWSTRAPLPDARTEVSVTTDGRLIYLVGGYAAGLSMPRALEVYDPAIDRWSSPTSIPEGINHTAVVHVGGKLYIVGGWRGPNNETSGTVHIYDIATNRWSTGAPMPTPRAALAAVVLDGKIHAIGGHAARARELETREHRVGSDGASVGTHEVYDPAANTWTRAAPMPTPRNHHAAAVINGRIHVVGGRVGNDYTLTAHEVYDPRSNTWAGAPPLPTGRSGIAAVELDARLYVFGGESFGAVHKTFSEAERYDPKMNKWESMPCMPTARHGLGAAALRGEIHVISGGPQPGGSFSTSHEVLTPAR